MNCFDLEQNGMPYISRWKKTEEDLTTLTNSTETGLNMTLQGFQKVISNFAFKIGPPPINNLNQKKENSRTALKTLSSFCHQHGSHGEPSFTQHQGN